ncbi:isoprenylcysteine carboxylmethyltransferase family protein [Candidatus Nomurabacteria bacterium]|nr:isoprenylcysteine carboxylmethyltransferase family protein [Candidatus Nomurabacteria bacterium]
MNKACQKTGMVHVILSRSYSVYLFCVIIGLILEMIYPLNISNIFYSNLGFIFMCVGTIFIYWAQSTSSTSKKKFLANTNAPRNFALGPYKYSRNPTHIGLLLVCFGFGFMIGSFFVIILTIFSFVITKLIFLPKEEGLLEKKYGEIYTKYKSAVKTWI